jgi:hypothetical protein
MINTRTLSEVLFAKIAVTKIPQLYFFRKFGIASSNLMVVKIRLTEKKLLRF